MPGERDLTVLLRDMTPDRRPGRYVFTSAEAIPTEARPIATVVEDEGISMVLDQAEAERLGLAYDTVMAMITLRIHSALDAVGLTAAVATALAEVGISCNVVAGRVHDHLFVPIDDGDRAIEALERLAAAAAGT